MKHVSTVAYILANIAIIHAFSIERPLGDRARRDVNTGAQRIGCLHMESFPGEYIYETDGDSTVCGMFIIGLPDQVIELEFLDFDVGCQNGGLLATVDGWETQGQFFPSEEDHQLPMSARYQTFCGRHAPRSIIRMSQNVALIQFRIASRGGFRIAVRFLRDMEPCNVVLMSETGLHTLQNYGERRNCSASLIYPERVQLVNLNVGKTAGMGVLELHSGETGTRHNCQQHGAHDYVQILGGSGLDNSLMTPTANVCGLDSRASGGAEYDVACTHTVVRLVSSGRYYNTVSFQHKQLTDHQLVTANSICE